MGIERRDRRTIIPTGDDPSAAIREMIDRRDHGAGFVDSLLQLSSVSGMLLTHMVIFLGKPVALFSFFWMPKVRDRKLK